MIDRPALRQPRPKVTWPGWAPPLSLPRAESASSQMVQVAIIVLGIGLATFILYLYLLPNSQISEAEAQIGQLQTQHATLIRQNTDVVRQISAHTDLATIQLRARELGMAPARNVIYLPAAVVEKLPAHEQAQVPAANTLALSPTTDETPALVKWSDMLKTRAVTVLHQLRPAASH